MRLPRLRFTVRRLMIVVAIAGMLIAGGLWAEKMIRLSRRYRHRAVSLGGIDATFQVEMRRWTTTKGPVSSIEVDRRALVRRDADLVHGIVAKYERAARYPWVSVVRDPHESWPDLP
jgi:hypothetical protein